MPDVSLPPALVDRMSREIGYFLLQEGARTRLTEFAEHVLKAMLAECEVRVGASENPDEAFMAALDADCDHGCHCEYRRCPVPCLHCAVKAAWLHGLAEGRRQMGNELAEAQAEAADLRALFQLQQTRMSEAGDLWRAEAPEERGNVLPDLGVLLTWLLDRDAKTRAVVEAATELSSAVDNQSRHYAEDVLAAAIDDLEGNYP